MDSGDSGRRVPRPWGGKREAGKVETGEEIPDTLATRGRCCPIKGPRQARDWGLFSETQVAIAPSGIPL